MINRRNWKLVKEYLSYRRKVDQVKESTIRLNECRLRHLLEWADDVPFEDAPNIQPGFVEYVRTARNDGKDMPLSSEYAGKSGSRSENGS